MQAYPIRTSGVDAGGIERLSAATLAVVLSNGSINSHCLDSPESVSLSSALYGGRIAQLVRSYGLKRKARVRAHVAPFFVASICAPFSFGTPELQHSFIESPSGTPYRGDLAKALRNSRNSATFSLNAI